MDRLEQQKIWLDLYKAAIVNASWSKIDDLTFTTNTLFQRFVERWIIKCSYNYTWPNGWNLTHKELSEWSMQYPPGKFVEITIPASRVGELDLVPGYVRAGNFDIIVPDWIIGCFRNFMFRVAE